MNIKRVNIENFKCFKGKFSLDLNPGINILVGNNEAGKSTILEAVHLGLSGILNGRYLKNQLSQYLFNATVVKEYIQSMNAGSPTVPPQIVIELYFGGRDLPIIDHLVPQVLSGRK